MSNHHNARTIYLAKRVETEITAHMTGVLDDYKITPKQYIILNFVLNNTSDLSSAQLSRRFLITPQSMNEVISVLQKKKLITKTTDTENKRILRIELTPKGKETLTNCNKAIDKLEKIFFRGLSASEHETFRMLLGKIINTPPKE